MCLPFHSFSFPLSSSPDFMSNSVAVPWKVQDAYFIRVHDPFYQFLVDLIIHFGFLYVLILLFRVFLLAETVFTV